MAELVSLLELEHGDIVEVSAGLFNVVGYYRGTNEDGDRIRLSSQIGACEGCSRYGSPKIEEFHFEGPATEKKIQRLGSRRELT